MEGQREPSRHIVNEIIYIEICAPNLLFPSIAIIAANAISKLLTKPIISIANLFKLGNVCMSGVCENLQFMLKKHSIR